MMDRKYEFQVEVSACYEPLSCDQVVSILNQTSFDMKSCTYQGGFLNSSKYNANYNAMILETLTIREMIIIIYY